MTASPFVERFECDSPDTGRLGGKGASLCRLVQHGYRVPPGFVIPVEAFSQTCRAVGLAAAIEELEQHLARGGDVAAAAAGVTERLRSARLPPDVLDPIVRAVDELALWDERDPGLIVRSSATVEDSAAHSFAGIFESLPIATPEALEPTIREVWLSAFSPRALTYYEQVGLSHLPTMAVVVQRFLAAERSGVMFTTFRGRTLVEHVEGDCEKLVKGEVTPEQLWLDGKSGIAEPSSLAAEHAHELARLAVALEEDFGAPQDVEWVLAGGAVHVVQSRPITTSTADPGATPEADAEPVLTGTPASGGWGSGDVHLVFNIEDALALDTGRVLVTPMTNPDMVVAMRKSAAIVTDVGGMICHAAIVSRELGLPCVVGTATATATLRAGELVTVSGSAGAVYRGDPAIERPAPARSATWSDVWSAWRDAALERPNVVPIVSTVDALAKLPSGLETIVLVPDVDLRTSSSGLWVDLAGMSAADRDAALDSYFRGVALVAAERSVRRVYVVPGAASPAHDVAVKVEEIGPPLVLGEPPDGLVGVPLAAAALRRVTPVRAPLIGMRDARAAALDTLKFFGHEPGSTQGPMPGAEKRGAWWAILPEYERFHHEFGTPAQAGDHTWLEVRPELVISALLKSLVQPGFEMVPRVLGFRDLPPMHTKWIRCRYHFRADTFASVWQAIVPATWDGEYMAELMRRVRASYEQLAEVLVLFPTTDDELAALSPERAVALITSWWPRWVEFFALCWFIQAQGDDILYPFVEETVGDNLSRVVDGEGFAWPGRAELVAPTTPVLSGEYMADVARLRTELQAAGLATTAAALTALEQDEHPDLARHVSEHLQRWHWMRDRDLLFEPWDTPERVIETALTTEPHAPATYDANLAANRLALSFHFDLAHASGRAAGLNHAARFLHDLNVERENHHVLWLKFSYPLRRLFVEIERRLVLAGSLQPGDVFFLQAPELIEATRRLPEPLPAELVRTVRNRRNGFLHEARLAAVDTAELVAEDDYY